jgi:mannose-6-phosphate isomerase-like protein (cupin superfamily)
MSILATLVLGPAALVAAYVVIGNLWHRVLAPLPAPDPSTFPRAGDRFGCRAEGVRQEITDVRDGWVYGTAVLEAGAAGPPLHVHDTFEETFTAQRGVLHMQIEDRVVEVQPGESITIPAGVPHRPFNPGTTAVEIGGGGRVMPVDFSAALVQIYRVMDERGTHPLTMMLQMSILDPMFDTHLADVPRAAQKAMSFLLAPAARLAGFRNYYPEWSLHPVG